MNAARSAKRRLIFSIRRGRLSLFEMTKIAAEIWNFGRLYLLLFFCIIVSSIIMLSGDMYE